jgi:hypothetical protein
MMSKRTTLSLISLMALVGAGILAVGWHAGPVVLAQPADPPPENAFTLTLTANRDAWIDELDPEANHGGDLTLHVEQSVDGVYQSYTLLDFDLTALPGDAQIAGASLGLHASAGQASDPFPIDPASIRTSWTEGNVKWSTRPTTIQVGDPASNFVADDWTYFDVGNIVSGWVSGTVPKYGIALRPGAGASGSRSFEARATSSPPQLVITYTRRAELTAVADTWVDQAHPSSNYGASTNLQASDGDAEWALVQFDLSSLPSEFHVYSATLGMYIFYNMAADANTRPLADDLSASAVTEAWGEMAANWNNRPASTYLSDPPTTFVVNGWTEWDVTNIVQRWADGSLSNHGFRLWADAGTGGGHWFSRENTEAPRLTIAYGEAPPDCNPITAVDVSGATQGVTGLPYTFDAVLLPAGADPPQSVTWTATDYAQQQSGESVTLSWNTAGLKTLTMVATHCGGTSSTVHTIDISTPPPTCSTPIQGVALVGPLVVETGSAYEYRAATIPYYATDPVTFTWEATGQSQIVDTNAANASLQSYNWDAAGSKTIEVTAENCGGTAVASIGVEVVDPADLPDLTISSAWNEADAERVGYVIHNLGATTVPGGSSVALEQGGSTPAADPYTSVLAPGGIGVGYVDFAWSCTTMSKTVGLLADFSEQVTELNESNNHWTDVWRCDQTPPTILTGPTVTDISETRANVRWTTDEDCQGWVEYSTSPYIQSRKESSSNNYLVSHNVGLTGLGAGNTYYVRAFCTDASGLTVNSEPVPFETDPPGSDPPVVRSLEVQPYAGSTFYEFWQVDVETEDDAYMDRVSCAMDGTPLGIDYSPDTGGDYPVYSVYLSPHALGLTRSAFFDTHQFSCTAYRLDPTAFTTQEQSVAITGDTAYPIQLWIEEPHPNHKIYVDGIAVPGGVTLDATVFAAAREWRCTASGFSEGDEVPPGLEAVKCEDQAAGAVDSLELWIAGELEDTVTPGVGELLNTLSADLTGLQVGTHELTAVAQKGSVQTEETSHLVVEQGEPGLEMDRAIRREGNKLIVTLTLHNNGTATANVHQIVDNVVGLQPIIETDGSTTPAHTVSIDDGQSTLDGSGARTKLVKIAFENPWMALETGESFSVDYVVVPVLHHWDRPPVIGSYWIATDVWRYDANANLVLESFNLSGTLVDDPSAGIVPLADATANAIRQADYVIVTHPDRVYVLLDSPSNDAEVLFSNMARLAALENGVLGYLLYYEADDLDDFVEPDGWWAQALNPSFNQIDQGYVLIVGETEIVPSYYSGSSNFVTGPCCVDYVHWTDQQFTNTAGETMRPELVVGRVIGNGLTELNAYLENMIHAAQGDDGYGYNRDRALLISGTGENSSDFRHNVEYVADQMNRDIADANVIHWTSFDGDWTRIMTWTKGLMPDNGMIFWNGHGNKSQWGDGVSYWDFPGFYDLGASNPGVLAASCKTGRYESDADTSIAETFLSNGAGAYVGSTESTEHESTGSAFRRGYSRWNTDESMGQALNRIERDIWGMELVFDHHKFWSYATNLYGDPKFGRLDPAAVVQPQGLEVALGPEDTTLRLSVPAPEISRVGDWDQVEIPGGGKLADMGGYAVPVWTTSVTFRPGTTVQDVTLVSRSNPRAYGDLSMKVLQGEDFGRPAPTSVEATATADGWYPEMEQVFDWWVEEGPDGSLALGIQVYPFTYHAATGDGLFTGRYEFNVDTYSTLVKVDALSAAADADPGDAVDIGLVLSNGGHPLDVIVQPSIRDMATSEVLGGLSAVTLHDLEGTATADLTWNTAPYPAGDYLIVVELLDVRGLVLDTAVAEYHLGTYGARLTQFSASASTFSPGDTISLSMTAVNTGSVPITGTAVFLVQESESLTQTRIITAPVNNLASGATRTWNAVWDSTGATADSYRVLGYVKFFAQTTEPMSLTLNRPRIFLPVVLRD